MLLNKFDISGNNIKSAANIIIINKMRTLRDKCETVKYIQHVENIQLGGNIELCKNIEHVENIEPVESIESHHNIENI